LLNVAVQVNYSIPSHLPQINLLLLFGEKSYLPFYYRKLAGNIPDVKTLQVLIRDLDILGYSKVKLVTDRGFYSAGNVNSLYKEHIKFLMAARTSLTFVKEVIEREGIKMRNWDHYCDKYDLYTYSETIAWNYSQKRPYKGDTVEEPRRMYLHLYYHPEKAVEDERDFNRHILCLKDELMTGKRLLVSSNAALEGKLFVEFIALIYLSYIKKHMQDKTSSKNTRYRACSTSMM